MSEFRQKISRREMLKLAGFGLILPALEGCAAGIPRSGTVNSYSSTIAHQVTVHGARARVVFPTQRIEDLRRQSRSHLEAEGMENGVYKYSVLIPEVPFYRESRGFVPCTQELIDDQRCAVLGEPLARTITHSSNIVIEYQAGSLQRLSLLFSPELDRNGGRGRREIDAREFNSVVREISGQDVRKAEIVLDITNYMITAHMIPVDERGRIVSGYDIGFVALGCTFHPEDRSFYGGISVLVDQR
jgi:hypothetical protein